MDTVLAFIYAAILAGVPLLYGTLGEIITEKAGHLNLGVEGMMYMGAAFGFWGGYITGSVFFAILFAFLAGMAGALIYAFLTVSLKANQNVTGLALTIFGTGVANFLGLSLQKNAAASAVVVSQNVVDALKPQYLGFLSDLPVIGNLLFLHSPFTYAVVILAIGLSWYLNHTHQGLNLRSIGENPGAADAAGVNVTLYKYVHLLLGGGICGIGGAYISLVTCSGNWQQNCVSGQGWIAVALVIFASWKPIRAILGALVFGALTILRLYIPTNVLNLPSAFYLMLPFFVTCVVLVVSSIRMRRESQAPAACGVNYFREER